MKTSILKLVSLAVTVAFVSSCGKSGGGGSGSAPREVSDGGAEVFFENQDTVGKYRAIIRPINTTVFGKVNSGIADINVDGSKLNISMWMDDVPPGVPHVQTIFTGSRCPVVKDDVNGDGYVDIAEAAPLMGKMLLPLDNDLNSQKSGEGKYPTTLTYTYNKTADLQLMMNDLKAGDENVTDTLTKLMPGEELNLEGRVIVIQGAPVTAILPATVAGLPGQTVHASLPISCGVIKRVNN